MATTYTDQQILTALREALFEVATNGAASWSVNGRTFTSLDIDKLQTAIQTYENRVNRMTRRMFAPITFREMK